MWGKFSCFRRTWDNGHYWHAQDSRSKSLKSRLGLELGISFLFPHLNDTRKAHRYRHMAHYDQSDRWKNNDSQAPRTIHHHFHSSHTHESPRLGYSSTIPIQPRIHYQVTHPGEIQDLKIQFLDI